MTNPQAILLATAWLFYFAIHSLLASLWIKRRIATHHLEWMPAYRLGFNLVAIGLLALPVGLMWAFRGDLIWSWEGSAGWVMNGLGLLALLGFVWSLRFYDGLEFLGLRQWRCRVTRVEDQEVLRISPLHRFVRHPWYSLGLVVLWTRPCCSPPTWSQPVSRSAHD